MNISTLLRNIYNAVSQHYQEDADGLCTCLGAPLPREGSSTAYSVDKSAFEQVRLENGSQRSVESNIFDQGGWTIKREDVTLQEKIGKGEFGDVRLGQYRWVEPSSA